MVVIGLLGGSAAKAVKPYFELELNRWFAANNRPRRPAVINLSTGGQRQPQQALIVASALLLGGEFDLLINLDGFNEIASGADFNPGNGVFPFFPYQWASRVSPTAEELSLAGRAAARRREQARLAAAGESSPLRRSAVFGLANRYQQERNAAEIIRLNRELAAVKSSYSLEKHGPRNRPGGAEELLTAAARRWYRGSLALAQLADLAGADYYHFLQPNQYVPDSKPLSPEELESAYKPDASSSYFAARGYPLLTDFNQDLQKQGVNYFDLTRIFLDHQETRYGDTCCHLTEQGNELLAAAMVARLEPALRCWARIARPRRFPL